MIIPSPVFGSHAQLVKEALNAIDIDCTVVADTETPASDVLAVLRKLKLKELEDTRIVDVYPLSETQKTVTLRSWLLDREKTLTPDFLREAEDKIVAALDKAGYPLKQG